jgi:hypothetical protein
MNTQNLFEGGNVAYPPPTAVHFIGKNVSFLMNYRLMEIN